MTGLDPALAAGYLLVVNFWAFASFWYDKVCAMAGNRRVAEANLLGIAMIGGTAGAYLGRQLFRHKTRKQPFSNVLFAILVVQLSLILGAVVYFL